MKQTIDGARADTIGGGKLPWLLLIRLALVNSIGFSGATLVPIWVSGMGARLDMAPWFGGLIATAQLIATAITNLLTPVVFANVPPARLALRALPCALALYLVIQTANPAAFAICCILAGGFLGIVLNSTNRIVAESEHVQKGYAIFQMSECTFSACFMLLGTLVAARFDLIHIFLCNASVCGLAILLLTGLPVGRIAPAPDRSPAKAPIHVAAIPMLFALCLFFIGQNSMLSYAVPLGRTVGLDPAWITGTVSLGMMVALMGALASEQLGERLGLRLPILGATLSLLLDFLVMGLGGNKLLFQAGLLWMSFVTMFIVPYFFTLLAKLDRTGRVASVGPAFLLTGLALGSAMATTVTTLWGISAVGPAASGALGVSMLLAFGAIRTLVIE